MGLRFNPPPNWPPPPPGFVPPPRWQPDPSWPPPPPGWQLWVPDDSVPEAPGDFPAGAAGIPPRPPDFRPGPAGPTRPDFPAWPGDFAAGPGELPGGPGDFPGGPGGFPGGPGGFPGGPGGFPGGPGGAPTAQIPGGPPQYPRGGHGARGPRARSGRTNGFAVAAFVLGLLGGSILSLIFAIVALRQIRGSGQRGRGLAIAGLVLSLLWGVALASYLFLYTPGPPAKQGASAGTPSSSPAASPGSGSGQQTTNVFSLRTGECFQNPPASQTVLGITYVTVVPCTTRHNAQVFVEFSVAGSSYPGSAPLKRQADLGCHARISKNVQRSKITATMTLRYLYPLAGSWATGHRTITCLIVDAKPDLKSSLLRSHPGH